MEKDRQPIMKEWTLDEWQKELNWRFGPYYEDFRFICPNCGRVNSGKEFKDAGAQPSDMYQHCIGRHVEGKGCNWCSYGLFGTKGHGDIIIMPDGKRVEVFKMAEA